MLGLIAEPAAGTTLDALVSECVAGPAGMDETRFLLPEADRARAAATEDCPWRGRIVQGTVHDENAEVLGGVAGHAGLFAPSATSPRWARRCAAAGAAARAGPRRRRSR